MPEELPKSFLEELQSLNEPTKRKVLVVATILIMFVIVYFWLGYFNGLVASVAQVPVADSEGQPQSQQSSGESGFFQNMKNGMAMVANDLAGAPQWLTNALQSPRQYNIQPPK